MKNIYDIDKNFKIETSLDIKDVVFRDARSAPFRIYGVFFEGDRFRRMPESVAKSVSDKVEYLHSNTAGGRLRFKTNSPYVALNAKINKPDKMPHFPLTGSVGFDLYLNEGEGDFYYKTFVPPFNISSGYESVIWLEGSAMREITVNFPLYSDVTELYIGLAESAELLPPEPYKIDLPVVYYGSSITQGGCASRPGNAYESIVSRAIGCDHINLGFSGSARAEWEISEYISGLDMSAFVFDYDHNAPNIEHLSATHERMFKEIRAAHPDLPIIIMSRPKWRLNADEKRRLEIIKETYDNALAAGDKNVYFIDGKTLMRECLDEGTVDSCHPNDLGFASMAKAVIKVLEEIFCNKCK